VEADKLPESPKLTVTGERARLTPAEKRKLDDMGQECLMLSSLDLEIKLTFFCSVWRIEQIMHDLFEAS